MVQDSVNPVSFFNASSNPKASVAENEVAANDEQSFGAALTRANRERAPEPRVEKRSAEKPKLGNREPFFPHKPLPVHADDGVSNVQPAQAPAKSSAELDFAEDSENGLDSDKGWEAAPAELDDRKGVVGQSYEGAAVSYPMSRIGKESMDEKTKETLEKQGLWNLPTVVMAQPSPQTIAMKDFVGTKDFMAVGRQGKSSSVPVQKPIAQFMASLENELGVTPDRLVQAIQNLPPGQLQMSPEKTMIQVVKQLGLKGSDETRAVELYSKMLVQLQSLDGKEKMQMPVAALGNPKTQAQAANQLGKEQGLLQSNQSETLSSQKGEMVSKNANLHKLEGKDAAPLIDKGSDVSQNGDKLVRNSDLKGADLKSMSYENMSKGQDSKSGFEQNQNSGQQFSGQGQNHVAARQEQASVKDQVRFDLKHDLSAEKMGKLEKPAMDQNPQAALQPVDSKMNVAAPAGTGALELKAADASTKHEAIQSIINNAQMLASKGGGEMHMTLKPDHLGEIQLRVAMEGNHVNVQMVTERGEVKKLIEQSVHELRHGLAQHDLSMNKLDVSVGDKTAGGFKQGMPDFGQARDFANQFHQQNGRREMLQDFSALRGNARNGLGQTGSMPSSAAHAQTAAGGRGSGRLNVMA